MSVVKVIEVLAQSDKSWEDAAQQAVMAVSRTVHDIQSVYVENFQAQVEGDRIVRYRVDVKISFKVDNT